MADQGKHSLLIAEDDPNIRYLIEVAADRVGGFRRIESAADGQAALELLRHREPCDYPDLLLSDLSMPRMDGLHLIRELKRDPNMRQIPIAIITSSNIPNDRRDAIAAGACAFIEKPHGIEALIDVIAALQKSCLLRTSAASR